MENNKTFFLGLIILVIIALIIVGFLIFSLKSEAPGDFFSFDEKADENGQKTAGDKKLGGETLTLAEQENKKLVDFEGPQNEIVIIAQKWSFSPNVIRVKRGEKVILKLISQDVPHGITIPEFKIRTTIEPGTETTVEFIADKAGEFDFFSHVYSGPEYRQMRGKLIVEE
ncbi:MAG: cupredoxin domain-containing protein [Patescibacteria group bacterium]|nr:cupredoxin domain-containing protein [Patescibacteria group bacterium]MDD5490929.1 cupredoxin domain-containing protein [Patescibacteria group bacterium]